MNRLARTFCSATIGCMLAAPAAPASAQEPARQGAGARGAGGRGAVPLDAAAEALSRVREIERNYNLALRASVAEPVVRDAPYSGEGVTTVTQILSDGTRIERMTTTRVWRDRMGRVRREQSAVGFDWLNPPNDSRQVVTITDPVANVTYTLDAANRTARTGLLARRVTRQAAGPAGPALEALPPRQINGLKVTGTRTTSTIPTGQIGNDRPIAITDENWESPELQVLVESRQSDPRTGVVEYRLTNISRAEPPPDLFVVPSDYTVIRQGFTLLPGARGVAPGTGGGGRGGRSNSVDQFGPPPEN